MRTFALVRDSAPRDARGAVAASCRAAVTGPQCADSAALMTSEVVTNALRYSAGAIRFGVEADTARVRVEIGDDEQAGPHAPVASEDAEGGRGMLIVAALASAWGVLPTAPGKVVWFEVAAQP